LAALAFFGSEFLKLSWHMIRSFKNKETEAIYEGRSVKKWLSFQDQIEKRLQILDMATTLEDLKNLPSNRFEALKGNRKGQFSIRINQQWRICFKWVEGEAHDIEIVDYH
jgi:proteic killer suppression protein